MPDVLIGFEVVNLGYPERSAPWRMTVDAYDTHEKKIKRYQIVGDHYNGSLNSAPIRTLDEVKVGTGRWGKEAHELAKEFERLDMEFAQKVEPFVRELIRAQIQLLHGEEGIKLLDEEANA